MKNIVYLIAPDSASEASFINEFIKQNIPFIIDNTKIAPRVIKEHKNPSDEVAINLASCLLNAYLKEFRYVAIACNTLQSWIPQAVSMLGNRINKSIRIISTFEESKREFSDRKKRPVWLGTTVTQREIKKKDFDTLLSLKHSTLQHQLQEIIWRTKAVSGSDISTAWHINKIYSKDILIYRTTDLLEKLQKYKLTSLILGCTELPIAFQMLPKDILEQFMIYDPAVFVANTIARAIRVKKNSEQVRIMEVQKTLEKIISNSTSSAQSLSSLTGAM